MSENIRRKNPILSTTYRFMTCCLGVFLIIYQAEIISRQMATRITVIDGITIIMLGEAIIRWLIMAFTAEVLLLVGSIYNFYRLVKN